MHTTSITSVLAKYTRTKMYSIVLNQLFLLLNAPNNIYRAKILRSRQSNAGNANNVGKTSPSFGDTMLIKTPTFSLVLTEVINMPKQYNIVVKIVNTVIVVISCIVLYCTKSTGLPHRIISIVASWPLDKNLDRNLKPQQNMMKLDSARVRMSKILLK